MSDTENHDKAADGGLRTTDLFGWVRTSDRLPGEIGDQADVLMWSPEWATWLKGLVTRWTDGSCEWAIYNQQDDRYHEWEYPPEFWMAPILPNNKDQAQPDNQNKPSKT